MRTWTLPRIKCIPEPKHISPILYSLYRLVDGRYVRVSDSSFSDVTLASIVYASRIGLDLTLSIREVKKIELPQAGIKWRASWSMRSECKWLLS